MVSTVVASRETCGCHQQYNGTSWSEVLGSERSKCLIDQLFVDSSAAIAHGGYSGFHLVLIRLKNGTEMLSIKYILWQHVMLTVSSCRCW